jgi:hypothetical protein
MERWLPNPATASDPELLKQVEFLGTLMGASCRTTGFIEIDFASWVFKALLGERATFHDISAVDARSAAGVAAAAGELTEEAWARQQQLDPCCWRVQLVSGRMKSLRGDGRAAVAYDERETYIEQATAAWVTQFEPQIEALKRGFFGTFPELGARLLTWRELERKICGQPDVSVDALKRIAKCEGSYSIDDEHMERLWEVLRSFSGAERKQFLGFVWGRGRLPANPTQPFTIDSSYGSDDSQLPRSHTCMFQLHLPKYSTKEVLRSRLLTAFQNHSVVSEMVQQRKPMDDEQLESDTIVSPTVALQIPGDAGHSEGMEQLFARMSLPQHLVQNINERFEIRDVQSLFDQPIDELRQHLQSLLRIHRLAPSAAAAAAELEPEPEPEPAGVQIGAAPPPAVPMAEPELGPAGEREPEPEHDGEVEVTRTALSLDPDAAAEVTDAVAIMKHTDLASDVIRHMKDLESEPAVQAAACGAIWRLATTPGSGDSAPEMPTSLQAVAVQELASADTHKLVLNAMRTHSAEPVVQAEGCHALQALIQVHGIMQGEFNRVVAEIIQHDGVAAFAAAMRAHPSVSKVQQHACLALKELLKGLTEDVDDTHGEEAAARKEQLLMLADQAKRVAEMAAKEGAAGLVAAAMVTHTHETVSFGYALLHQCIGCVEHHLQKCHVITT